MEGDRLDARQCVVVRLEPALVRVLATVKDAGDKAGKKGL